MKRVVEGDTSYPDWEFCVAWAELQKDRLVADPDSG